MTATPALLIAAAGVGFGHAVLPDHWLPLAVVGRTRRYPLSRVARLSALAGVAHVLVSLLLGGALVAIGLQFRSTVEHAQSAIIGGLLIGTGALFCAFEFSRLGHHHEHPHPHHDPPGAPTLAAVMVPFGAAASPDLTILPVFLAAAAAGPGAAIGSLIVFGTVTIATITGLTLLAAAGGYQLRGRWLERWGNIVTAAVLIVIGALVLAGVL